MDRPYKDLSELTLMDDYMFGVVMQDPKLAKAVIEAILNVRLRRVEYVEPQKSMKERYDAKGVRLDLYVEDEDGTVYNVEIQTTDKRNLPKRMRYYQSIIDLHILSPGANYQKLRKSYVIFICNYDPFGLNRTVYTFENRCLEAPELNFGDETVKVVANTRGTEGETGEALSELLRYLDRGTVSGETSRSLEEAVNDVKNSEERRREYMVMMAREMEIREEGREEGRVEGREEGRAEGREEGRDEGMALMAVLIKKLSTLGRLGDVERITEDPSYCKRLLKEFQLI